MDDDHRPGAGTWVPVGADVPELRAAAQDCRGCELWRDATQTVFGQGPQRATLMFVGEQPGDSEDRAGEPFVGPAGRLLDRAVRAAGIARDDVYVTNAVKHFRFEQRGKRRIHSTPQVAHIKACHPWLDGEMEAVDPRVVVCLGATAARAVVGRTVRIGAERGTPIPIGHRVAIVTTHPSALLRMDDEADRSIAFDALVADLAAAARV